MKSRRRGSSPAARDTRPGAATSGSLFDDLRTDNPGIVGTRLLNHDLTVHQGAQASRESIVLVDNDFFKVFDLPLAAGDRETALRTPGDVILTEAMAAKYFPGQRPQSVIGKTLNLTDDQGTADYRVSAVAKTLPNNTDQQFDFIRLLTPAYTDTVGNWKHYGSQRLQTVLRIDNPAEAARLNSGFRDFANRHAANQFGTDKPDTVFRLSADPLTGIHLADDKARNSIYALGLVGVLAFLIAAINYINLATARAGMRAKEVAVRKTLGATQGDLRTQFLCEAVLVTLLAMLIGLSLVEVGLPLINSFGALHLKLDYVGEAVPLALAGGFILLVGLPGRALPRFRAGRFPPGPGAGVVAHPLLAAAGPSAPARGWWCCSSPSSSLSSSWSWASSPSSST
ncbi:MAG: ABC transporter permease [Asticcacaulis sp.]